MKIRSFTYFDLGNVTYFVLVKLSVREFGFRDTRIYSLEKLI